ncbi:MAG: mutY [Flavipsychrobacter sp.]|jgi:A/G-specific adenine glycosylase|nr:mutY [Flavipsychrobacter sp.]
MNVSRNSKQFFTTQLVDWHHTANDRSLPWKQEKDPYKIWLSEIILQQTRALQGLPYYLKFTEAYPTVKALAKAKDEDAFRLWQGLGYYNRCKNMLATARIIAGELKGKFPQTYEGLLELKGIGPYTAAAIASFAFGRHNAVVDGNVYRVLSRYFGIDSPIDSTEGKKEFAGLAQELLYKNDSAAYNQAIMDLGATVCTPASPKCSDCPLQKHCTAYKQELTTLLPVKVKKTAVSTRYFHYVLLTSGDKLWIRKRTESDIWQNLYEPYLVEHTHSLDVTTLAAHPSYKALKLKAVPEYEGSLKQRLTHRIIETRFFNAPVKKGTQLPELQGEWVPVSALKNYGFPKTIVSFLEKKLYF